ncbi:MAG: alpha/beta fold hydrolase [Pseudonocardia sp.]
MTAADGVQLHVQTAGPADAPVTVVLTHGWTLDARIWGPVADRVAGPARVVRYDHRGHGRSDAAPAETMTLDQLADDLAAVIAATAPDGPLVLGGHSMGGMAVMALAERHPGLVERVRGLALVATASGGLAGHSFGLSPRAAAVVRTVERRLYTSRHWARRSTLGNPRVLAPALHWLLLGPGADRTARRLTCAAIASCRPVTVSGFRPTLEAHERDAALAAFADVPTVVLVGSQDKLTPVRSARRIATVLPSAGLTIYPQAGHMLPVERVTAVSGHLSALAALAAAPAARP